MVQKIFSPKVYKMMADAIENRRKDIDGFDPNESYPVEVETEDCYFIDFEVQFDYEVNDDSFDHAFGTWHDPCPYLEPTNIIGIDNVEVYKDNRQVENHNYNEDDFWSQFEVTERGGFKAGDKIGVKIGREVREGEFLAYITENGWYKVRLNGKVNYYPNICKIA